MVSALRAPAARVWFYWTLTWNVIVLGSMWPFWMRALTLRPTADTFSAWLRVWARLVLGGCGYRVESEGTPPVGPVVYAANHQAMMDIPALALGIGASFVFIARSELRRLPLVGSILDRSRCIFVDRDTPRGIAAVLIETRKRIEAGESVLFFPEGTRSYGRVLQPFMPGAALVAQRARVPIVPVAIDGAYRLLNEKGKTARPGRVTVRIGAPIEAVGTPSEIIETVRAEIDALLP